MKTAQAQHRNRKKAFTIVELIIVITIIGVLMSATFIGGTAMTKNAKLKAVQSDMKNYAAVLQECLLAHPEFCTLDDALAAGDANDLAMSKAFGTINQYLDAELKFTEVSPGLYSSERKDPYGTPYQLLLSGANILGKSEFRIYVRSYGPDRNAASDATYADEDDLLLVMQNVNNEIKSTMFDCGDIDFKDSDNSAIHPDNGKITITVSDCTNNILDITAVYLK